MDGLQYIFDPGDLKLIPMVPHVGLTLFPLNYCRIALLTVPRQYVQGSKLDQTTRRVNIA